MLHRSVSALLLFALGACAGQAGPAFKEPPGGSFTAETHRLKIGDGTAAPLQGASVTKDFFTATGVAPLLGRFFVDGDFAAGGPSSVVLSNALWDERLGRSPTIIGQTIEIDGRPSFVVGIAPKGFEPAGALFWMPKKS